MPSPLHHLSHLTTSPKRHVISTEVSAFAAAVERPLYFVLACYVAAPSIAIPIVVPLPLPLPLPSPLPLPLWLRLRLQLQLGTASFSLASQTRCEAASALPKAGVKAKPKRLIYCRCFSSIPATNLQTSARNLSSPKII
jgi:hypothetical protein